MSENLREEELVMTNIGNNNNKYWKVTMGPDYTCYVEFGRVEAKNPGKQTKVFTEQYLADAFIDKKVGEKEKKGYVKSKTMAGSMAQTESVNGGNLQDLALKQIGADSPETAKLIKYLTQVNIHAITASTKITYDESTGDFRTPLGIVTQDGINEARDLLDQLGDCVESKTAFTDKNFIKLVESYMMIIPQNVGAHQNARFGVEDIFPNKDAIQVQTGILDALEASVKKILTTGVDDKGKKADIEDAPKVFSVKLELVNDSNVIDRIKKKFKRTSKSMHTSSRLDVKRVFSVEIDTMKTSYDKVIAGDVRTANVHELWHGTRAANLLSILKGGLMIPRSSAGHVTGRMFGDGVYFSDQSTKSLNYSQGYWGGGSRDNNCFMFLADVAMGRSYTPSSYGGNLPKPGYDSTYAVGGQSGVMNNEMIVYETNRCNLTYLIEFE
jgi:poly [ADP-ribose] polymerase 2/3/4